MLKGFYDFVEPHRHCNWLHWSMRDINFGFAALGRRYRVLGGIPVGIPEAQRVDWPVCLPAFPMKVLKYLAIVR